jgi:hypothetical protein
LEKGLTLSQDARLHGRSGSLTGGNWFFSGMQMDFIWQEGMAVSREQMKYRQEKNIARWE